MTLKQFIYLASGVATAYLIFILIVPHYPVIAWPFIIIFVLLGVAFAFLPFKGRPLDQWVKSFFKAIYSPTKRVWFKNGKTYQNDPLFNSRFIMYNQGTTQIQPEEAPPPVPKPIQPQLPTQPQLQPIPTVHITTAPPPTVPHPPSPTPQKPIPLPTPDELKKTVELARQAQNLKLKIIQSEKALSEIKSAASKPTAIPVDYSHEANKLISDLQNLVSNASDIKHKLDEITHAEESKPFFSGAGAPKLVRVTPSPKPKQQMALTTFPNVINGIIRDRLGNYLEGVVSVIYDKEGLPVRALKTDKLGQFSGATPLPNGVYTLELEKDNFNFDVLQIDLTGQILPPLIITAKEAVTS